jgi:hypothetical protein
MREGDVGCAAGEDLPMRTQTFQALRDLMVRGTARR